MTDDIRARHYEKFYDDYERGTWLISPVDEDGYVKATIIVDGLTGPQADAILAALDAANADADRLAEALRDVLTAIDGDGWDAAAAALDAHDAREERP